MSNESETTPANPTPVASGELLAAGCPQYLLGCVEGYQCYGVRLAIKALEVEAKLRRKRGYRASAKLAADLAQRMKRTLKLKQPWPKAMEWEAFEKAANAELSHRHDERK